MEADPQTPVSASSMAPYITTNCHGSGAWDASVGENRDASVISTVGEKRGASMISINDSEVTADDFRHNFVYSTSKRH